MALNLTISDLLKNHLFRHLKQKNAKVDTARIKWEGILDLFDQSSSSRSIWTDSFIINGCRAMSTSQDRSCSASIKKEINKSVARDYLDDLVADSPCYRAVQEPDFRKWIQGQRNLRECSQL